jgi:hypothetical protein
MPLRHKDAPPEPELYAPIAWTSAAAYEDILYEKAERIAKITINRPEVRNAFRPQTLAELRDAWTTATSATTRSPSRASAASTPGSSTSRSGGCPSP